MIFVNIGSNIDHLAVFLLVVFFWNIQLTVLFNVFLSTEMNSCLDTTLESCDIIILNRAIPVIIHVDYRRSMPFLYSSATIFLVWLCCKSHLQIFFLVWKNCFIAIVGIRRLFYPYILFDMSLFITEGVRWVDYSQVFSGKIHVNSLEYGVNIVLGPHRTSVTIYDGVRYQTNFHIFH